MELPIIWMGQSKKDLIALPEGVQDEVGYALSQEQLGETATSSTPMKGKLRGVREIRIDEGGDTFRSMYTAEFDGVIYVLDALKKKSKKGAATPQADLDRILELFKRAREHYEKNGPPKV